MAVSIRSCASYQERMDQMYLDFRKWTSRLQSRKHDRPRLPNHSPCCLPYRTISILDVFWTFAGFCKTQHERTQVLVELNPRYVYMQFAVPNNIECSTKPDVSRIAHPRCLVDFRARLEAHWHICSIGLYAPCLPFGQHTWNCHTGLRFSGFFPPPWRKTLPSNNPLLPSVVH
jgi:hypothetical protein